MKNKITYSYIFLDDSFHRKKYSLGLSLVIFSFHLQNFHTGLFFHVAFLYTLFLSSFMISNLPALEFDVSVKFIFKKIYNACRPFFNSNHKQFLYFISYYQPDVNGSSLQGHSSCCWCRYMSAYPIIVSDYMIRISSNASNRRHQFFANKPFSTFHEFIQSIYIRKTFMICFDSSYCFSISEKTSKSFALLLNMFGVVNYIEFSYFLPHIVSF